METPTKAAAHFKDRHFDDKVKKSYMTCKFCLKKLVDCGNTTGMVSHLKSCRPNLLLSNQVKSLKSNIFQVDMTSSDPANGSPQPTTPVKLTNQQDTPLKAMLLSG